MQAISGSLKMLTVMTQLMGYSEDCHFQAESRYSTLIAARLNSRNTCPLDCEAA